MQEIVNKYAPDYFSPYLLPILQYPYDNRNQYKDELYRTNKSLKGIAKLVGLSVPLTLYVARHSWASIVKSKNIPISVISQGMGYDSEITTQNLSGFVGQRRSRWNKRSDIKGFVEGDDI